MTLQNDFKDSSALHWLGRQAVHAFMLKSYNERKHHADTVLQEVTAIFASVVVRNLSGNSHLSTHDACLACYPCTPDDYFRAVTGKMAYCSLRNSEVQLSY
jgi:hypothetical protein